MTPMDHLECRLMLRQEIGEQTRKDEPQSRENVAFDDKVRNHRDDATE